MEDKPEEIVVEEETGSSEKSFPRKSVEKSPAFCLICNATIGVSTRNICPIFQLNVSSSEQPVANILSVILGQEIRSEVVHSDVICKKCYKLCNEVDELQERLSEIKMEINNIYKKTVKKIEEDSGIVEPLSPGMKAATTPKRKGRPPKSNASSVDLSQSEDLVLSDDSDLDDDQSADYVPRSAIKNIRRSQDIQNIHEPQIKLETEDADMTMDALGKPQVARRKPIPRTRNDAPNIIPKMIISRSGKIYTCLLCSADEKVQGDARALINHMKEVHEIRLYICDICGMEFLKRSEMSVHLENHVAVDEAEFECEVCSRVFNNLRLFRVHKRLHNPQSKNHVCDTCGKAFLSKNMLEEHINTHTGLRPFKCGECGKDFASKYSVKAHEKTHSERPRPYKCNSCSKSFISEHNLAQHEKTHLGVKNFACQVCGKSFSTSRNLEVHSVIHTGYKPFSCRVCGKSFSRKAEIRDHERTHTGEKPYQCEFCGATFGQRSNLQSHKRATHYDDKRYQCVECGKAFKRRRLLDYHIKAAHTGERPFKCQVCNATFIYPEHFKKHRRIHTGEKPFACEVCGKAFNSRDNRNAHRFVHSDKKPYECLECGTGFMRKPQLYNHMHVHGHVNDTIVVNQPRLTTDEEFLIQEQEAHLELIMSESHEKWKSDATVFEGEQEVILGSKDEVAEDGQQYNEEVGHLIIDGQVQFADGESLELDSSTITETMGTSLLVPATSNSEFTVENAETTTLDTADGAVHLVHISLPESADPNQQGAWFNIVQQ